MALTRDEARKLAHLLRRAGFGARPKEWSEWSGLGLVNSTQRLLNPEAVPDHLAEVLEAIGGDYVDFENLESVKNWWIYRMVHTKRPLEEKMTLFWHNHFATAYYKVGSVPWMWRQNETFRKYALGNFRTLLQQLTRDPAMLVWLDGNQNRNGKPNENYAREILELFSMGVGSGYTEKDIQEAARSFTGWRYDGGLKTFIFDPYLHDDGSKTFLGQTGNYHGDDIIDIVCRQPATAKFLCLKLFKFFAHENPSEADLAPLQQTYFKSGFDMRAVLQALFTSPGFYSEASFYAKIKSPVEFAVTTMRTLDAPLAIAGGISGQVSAMGQDLFNPPSVKGWLEGREWINTRTLLARINFASQLAYEANRRGIVADLLQRGLLGANGSVDTPAQAVDTLWEALLPGRAMTSKTRVALMKYVTDGMAEGGGMDAMPAMNGQMGGAMGGSMQASGSSKLPDLKTANVDPKVKAQVESKLPGLLNLILSAPDYQLA